MKQQDKKIEICSCPNYSVVSPLDFGDNVECLGDLESLVKENPIVPCQFCEDKTNLNLQ